MLLSEAEAQTRWCPHIRVARNEPLDQTRNIDEPGNSVIVAGCNSDALGRTRIPVACRCIASGCMAWRWAGWETTFDTVAPAPRPMDRVGPRLGFCGLAGTPALFPPGRD